MSDKLAVLIQILLILALPVFIVACDDTSDSDEAAIALTESFVASNGVSFNYPEGWFVQESGQIITIANEQAVLEASEDEELGDDTFGIVISAPRPIDQLAVGEAYQDKSSDELLAIMADELGHLDTTITELEIDGRTALRASIDQEAGDGFAVVLDAGNNTFIIAVAATSKGKLGDFKATGMAIIESVRYTP